MQQAANVSPFLCLRATFMSQWHTELYMLGLLCLAAGMRHNYITLLQDFLYQMESLCNRKIQPRAVVLSHFQHGKCMCVCVCDAIAVWKLNMMSSLASLLNGLYVFVGMYLARGWSQFGYTFKSRIWKMSLKSLRSGVGKSFLKGLDSQYFSFCRPRGKNRGIT